MKKLVLLASLALLLSLVVGVDHALAKQSIGPEKGLPAQETATEPMTATIKIPFLEEWMSSGHADTTAEPFNHWNEEDPAEIPVECAKCHSSIGYQDFHGVDGSAVGVVDAPAAIGSVVDCVACHNEATIVKDSVVMPSGLEITGLGDESRCMECHQGRESSVSVNDAIAEAGVGEDEVSEDLGFRNIHYYAAAATKYGTLAKGGYEYEGKSYDAKFGHVEGYETCIECHNPHTLELKLDNCVECHEGVTEEEDLRDVRMAGSQVDYDGDGDEEEGIYYEIEGLQDALYQAIRDYAGEVVGVPLAYDPAAYPYFFIDANENGAVDEDEGTTENRFAAWTPRLVKAAYNYQTSAKDPGAFAHGGKYIIELLYDSVADLNSAMATPADIANLRRTDAGHFASSEEPFRHWDAEGVVPGTCARCHTDTGLPMYLKEGVTISQAPANGLRCTTCHNDLDEFTRHEVTEVKFPSGAVIDSGDPDTNLCMTCHQGRESAVSVDTLIGDLGDDELSEQLRFLNPHYFAAGATRNGGEAQGAYQYADQEYVGYFDHDPDYNNCTDCHLTHGLEVEWESCTECHSEVESAENLRDIRYNYVDYDGDGEDEEGLYYEIDTMREALFAAIQDYAANTAGAGLVYEGDVNPYFFIDTNANGVADAEEINRDNRFVAWTPRLLRAAYNYQYSGKDPGAFTHNGQYIVQALYDSLEDLDGDVSGMTRP